MNWKEMIGSVAPLLGTAIGGPFGGMAGRWLAGELGVEEDKLDEIVMGADSETMFKIKELDAKFKTEMKRIGLEEEQLHAADRDSARTMAAKTSLAPQAIISTIFIIGFLVILYMVFGKGIVIDDTMRDTAIFLLGILSAGVTQIMNFFFGSSSGSKQKTADLLAKK